MKHYRIFDVVLASNIDLPELRSVESTSPDIIFICHTDSFQKTLGINWLHEWTDVQGKLVAAYARIPEGLLLSVPNLADFVFRPDCADLHAYPASSDVDSAGLRHALLDRVIPMCLGHVGRQMLHASAVEVEGEPGVIVFVGDTGAGKSTLAASFLADGARLVSDDCLMLAPGRGWCQVIPGYFGIRLHDDSSMYLFEQVGRIGSVASYSQKKRLTLGQALAEGDADRQPSPIRGIFLLGSPSDSVILEPIATAQDVMMLVKQHFFFDVRDREQAERQFAHLRYLLGAGVPIFKLSYPRNFDALQEIRVAILGSLLRFPIWGATGKLHTK